MPSVKLYTIDYMPYSWSKLRINQLLLFLWWTANLTFASPILSDDTLRSIRAPRREIDIGNGKLLAPLLRPRVPGSIGSEEVLEHLMHFFEQELPEWTLEVQNSSSTTPTSNGEEIIFQNLIATREPPWAEEGDTERLILAAHRDSKLIPRGFIGATDSAVPCAILMHVARSIDEALSRKWSQEWGQSKDEKSVQILFLDGEEAFGPVWTQTDSLYGSRALAEEWELRRYPDNRRCSSPLRCVDLFVLLDLLGAPEPVVPSYYRDSHWAYKRMATLEGRLWGAGVGKFSRSNKQLFLPDGNKRIKDAWTPSVEDDHLPFMIRNVSILHIIPTKYPKVWHTLDDDGAHLDLAVAADWAVLITAFVAEWLELDNYYSDRTQGYTHHMGKDEM